MSMSQIEPLALEKKKRLIIAMRMLASLCLPFPVLYEVFSMLPPSLTEQENAFDIQRFCQGVFRFSFHKCYSSILTTLCNTSAF
jgi:hypothetical protein